MLTDLIVRKMSDCLAEEQRGAGGGSRGGWERMAGPLRADWMAQLIDHL